MTDRQGNDAAETMPAPAEYPAGSRVPVIEDKHRAKMVADLYDAGWSYWLIAQALSITTEQARYALLTSGDRLNG